MANRTIKDKRAVYIQVFKNEAAKEVLSDLRTFCCATKTTFAKDPMEFARNEGRREVFLQIMNMIKVDFDEVYDYDPDDYLD